MPTTIGTCTVGPSGHRVTSAADKKPPFRPFVWNGGVSLNSLYSGSESNVGFRETVKPTCMTEM